MAKGVVKNKGKKAEVSLTSVGKEVGGLKKWRDGMDKWRDDVDVNLGTLNLEVGGLKKWRDGVDKKFDGLVDLYCQLNLNILDIHSKMDMRHSEYMETMDAVMEEIKVSQREREILGHSYVNLDNEVAGHEKRLRVLENIKN